MTGALLSEVWPDYPSHKSKKTKRKNPVVLVGKGVMYDTGGLSLKPTPNSMDMMKCDMGGAAAVIGAIYALSFSKADRSPLAKTWMLA